MIEIYDDALALYKELFEVLGSKRGWLHYDQTFHAASSIVANIAEGEGTERGKQARSAYRWSIARGELFETLAWIDIALIENMVSLEEVQELKGKLEKLGDVLKKSVETIDASQYLKEDDTMERARRETERIMKYAGLHY